ncbi:WD40/YVTN/BNR-like repeat-containing protein [Endozoicomonas euniceicola]|uniref:YCF48-related protein n=1 Tax=Endozoicomonas euniceicola TaxID=1234143 RepID=A0ABY6GVD5_9GAMM|nr:YCF48-related protein [Endozoicomonas euniceicola]UYM16730.1 YCF48-related protein [Endozoicomonas euniceicola]
MTRLSSLLVLRLFCVWRLARCLSGFPGALFLVIVVLFSGGLPVDGQASDTVIKERYAVISGKASTSLLLDITRLPDSQRLVVVGDRGHVLFSDDDGRSWQQSRVPTIQMLTAVTFPSRSVGYAVGHDNLILKSEDAGENWQRVYRNIEMQAPLLDVWFRSEQRGLAVGAYGTILSTDDGGKTWTDIRDSINNEDEFHYNGIASDGLNNLYLAGEAGILYHSADAGETWNTLTGPYEGSLFGVSASGDEVIIHGLRGNVFRSQNHGKSWLALASGTENSLFGSLLLDDGSSFLVGTSGTVLSGLTGRWQITHREDRMPLSALAEASDGAIVVVGQGGVKRINEKNQ